ncbi:N-acyl homoserine lactonase family protein [Pseudonocardia ailaonensis]|uniref:N-acyl homoserine lactonase family protein n=1 Tax=Pseudonocardia ailaonensis TaxID=367279 RepID=A0ABN2N6V7_9PSEU
MSLKVMPVYTGRLVNSERSIQQYLTGYGEKIDVHSYIWMIVGGEAPIAVDLGVGSSAVVDRHHGRRLEQDLAPREALEAAGIDPGEVRLVIQTHLHWDHCLGAELNLFPNAEVAVQVDEIRYASMPMAPHEIMYNAKVINDVAGRARARDGIRLVGGDWTAAEGVRVLHTPGHTPGLQIPVVETAVGTVAIGSDNVPLQSSMRGATPADWIPPAIHGDLEQTYRSMARLADLAEVILPSHDSGPMEHGPYG